ncbi:hypothetical protein A7P98_06595 [Eikenella sp. NML080894]|uniref:hypothetical protein n=1 Tax=Eikenella sp. NML080894 TaxID=1795830 RepID=UPI0007E24C06|nr:hypothetical protein [Eikenella sp. NML080894]OAM35540.1 hypothetical protein A7P98_06595 [Eikenella sp. NML080894]
MRGLLTGYGGGTASLSKVVMFSGHLVCSAVIGWQAYKGSLHFDFYLAYICACYGANSTNKAISILGRRPAASRDEQGEAS